MENGFYPPNTVQALLLTDLVQQNTKAVLNSRLEKQATIAPLFFGADAFKTLQSVCDRLIPQPDRIDKIDLAGMLDEHLHTGVGNGWRYNEMPPDDKAFLLGINGIEETAQTMHGEAFVVLDEDEQDEILTAIQINNVIGETWKTLPPDIFFEELLASLVELYYSHPIAKNEIGEVAFADAKGWQHIGLNEHEPQEPISLKMAENDK